MFLVIESGGLVMYVFLTVVAICIFFAIVIKMFIKDSKHDLVIEIGKNKFSMKKHDKE